MRVRERLPGENSQESTQVKELASKECIAISLELECLASENTDLDGRTTESRSSNDVAASVFLK